MVVIIISRLLQQLIYFFAGYHNVWFISLQIITVVGLTLLACQVIMGRTVEPKYPLEDDLSEGDEIDTHTELVDIDACLLSCYLCTEVRKSACLWLRKQCMIMVFSIYLLHYKYFLASVMGFAPGLTGASDWIKPEWPCCYHHWLFCDSNPPVTVTVVRFT